MIVISEGVEQVNYSEPNIEVELSEDYPELADVDFDVIEQVREIEQAEVIYADISDTYAVNVFSNGDKVVTVRYHPQGANSVVVYDRDGTELMRENRERTDYTVKVLESVLDEF